MNLQSDPGTAESNEMMQPLPLNLLPPLPGDEAH